MKAFTHGEYVVLDGDSDELHRVAELLEEHGEEGREAAAKIRRGLERGATRIAVTQGQAELTARAIEGRDEAVAGEIQGALERLGSGEDG